MKKSQNRICPLGQEGYPFQLMPLPYPYQGLLPPIDEETLRIHHDKLMANYVEKLNQALAPYPAYHNWSLRRLLENLILLPRELQTPVRNNGGGVYNHTLYFKGMASPGSSPARGHLIDRIRGDFGSLEDFFALFKQSALDVFGSGYTWLALRGSSLVIVNTPNQDTVLPLGLCPILNLDVWEHAYFLQYQNRRAEYIDAWFTLINWQYAGENYLCCLKSQS